MKKIIVLGSNGMAGHIVTLGLRAEIKKYKVIAVARTKSQVNPDVLMDISDFDKAVNREELDYWWKTTGKLHESLANRIWTVNSDATYQPEEARTGNHRRVLHYKLIPGKERDFWRYRTRLKAALKASGWPSRVGVMNCQSGCNGRWVQIRYHHESFAGEAKDNQEMFPVVVAKYNEMYGEEAYKDDSDRLAQSVSDNWTQHQKLRSEMSSNW